MAELNFGYLPGDSFFHRLDARVKLIGLILISIATLHARMAPLLLLLGMALLPLFSIGLSPVKILRELRYFFVLLFFVFAARSLSTPGEALFSFMGISPTLEGTLMGLLVSCRLLLIALAGMLLMATTRTWEIKAAVSRLLAPVPFIPHARIGVMIGLTLRFIPMILHQVRQTQDAQRARGIEARGFFYRLTRLMIPLMRRTLKDADSMAIAMEARCYAEERTDPQLNAEKRDWAALAGAVSICGFVILL